MKYLLSIALLCCGLSSVYAQTHYRERFSFNGYGPVSPPRIVNIDSTSYLYVGSTEVIPGGYKIMGYDRRSDEVVFMETDRRFEDIRITKHTAIGMAVAAKETLPDGSILMVGSRLDTGNTLMARIVRVSPAGDLLYQNNLRGLRFKALAPLGGGRFLAADLGISQQQKLILITYEIDSTGVFGPQIQEIPPGTGGVLRAIQPRPGGGFIIMTGSWLGLIFLDSAGRIEGVQSIGPLDDPNTSDQESFQHSFSLIPSHGGYLIPGVETVYDSIGWYQRHHFKIVRIDAQGQVEWTKTLPVEHEEAASSGVRFKYATGTPDGGMLIVSGFGGYSSALKRVDRLGNLQWGLSMTDINYHQGSRSFPDWRSVQVLGDGRMLINGYAMMDAWNGMSGGLFPAYVLLGPDFYTAAEPDQTIASLRVYPNPFDEALSVQLPTGNRNWRLQLSDLQGRILMQALAPAGSESYSFNTIHLAQGMYLLSCYDGQRIITHKVMKL